MQAGRRFVPRVQARTGVEPGCQLGDELDTLGLPTAERVGRLPEVQVTEAELVQKLEVIERRLTMRARMARAAV